MPTQTIPQHTYPQNLPEFFVGGGFKNDQGEVVYVCDWDYYKGQSIGYEISRDDNGHVVGSYATGTNVDLTGWAESDTMSIDEMVEHIVSLAQNHIDATPTP